LRVPNRVTFRVRRRTIQWQNQFPSKKPLTVSMSKLGRIIIGALAVEARANPSATAHISRLVWNPKSSGPPRLSKFGCAGANLAAISHFAMGRTKPCRRGAKDGIIDRSVRREASLLREHSHSMTRHAASAGNPSSEGIVSRCRLGPLLSKGVATPV
jgi:hypothetical protein